MGSLPCDEGRDCTDWIDWILVTEKVTGSWYGRIVGSGTGREVVSHLEQRASIVTDGAKRMRCGLGIPRP